MKTIPRVIFDGNQTTSEYDLPNEGILNPPNGAFEDEREQHYGYSLKATSSNTFAAGIIEGMATNIVGVGYTLHPKIDHNALAISHEQAHAKGIELERIFNRYALDKAISIEGTHNLHQIADIAYRTQLVTGNCFALLLNGEGVKDERSGINLKVKLLDTAYLYDSRLNRLLNSHPLNFKENSDNGEVEGIVRDTNGKVIGYTFYKNHPYNQNSVVATSHTNPDDLVTVPRYSGIKQNVIHLYDTKRAGQVVAVPFISVVAEVLKDISEFAKAEIDAAKLNAHFAGFVYNEMPDEGGLGLDTAPADENGIKIGKGNLVRLEKGWKIAFADPARPNENYSGFVEMKIKELCIGINYPFEMFMKLFNTSYTASRGAVIEGQKMFKVKRFSLASDFYTPLYEQILLQEILEGRLHLKGFLDDPIMRNAWLGAEWVWDAQEDMNKLNAVKASDASVKAGFSTRERESKLMNGSSFVENVEQSAIETETLEDSKSPYVGEMNPQKIELAEMQVKAQEEARLKDGDKPNQFGDKKQKGD